ncbi:helix-turn-helix domain-containing protein [Brevibacillus parabrevis]|jgi:AraC-type DNA-binding domain-containing proteins|uniref:helix-turn-helix domain-containing protein n=1 Tax=Brevibacillus parabrevis TaxID=54914 RepID=UPI003CD0D831
MRNGRNCHAYVWTAFRKHRLKKGFRLEQLRVSDYVLCYVAEGSGEITVNAKKHVLEAGKLIMLTPAMHVDELVFHAGPVHIYRLQYARTGALGAATSTGRDEEVALHTEPHPAKQWTGAEVFPVSSAVSFAAKLEELFRLGQEAEEDCVSYLRAQALFCDLLATACEEQKARQQGGDTSVAATIDYMKKHFREALDLGALPKLAGLTPSSYCRAFKRAVGMTPGEYLTQLRMDEAKAMLCESSSANRVKDVARSVGFSDELYFSRLFKKREGLSPQIYMKQAGQRVAVASKLFLQDHFLAIGIQPIAAPSFPNYFSTRTGFPIYLQQRLRGTKALNAEQNITPQDILSLSPDVIVQIDTGAEKEQRQWSKLGEAVIFNGYLKWYEYQLQLATVFNKESQAERVIHHVDKVEKQAKDALLPVTRKGHWTIVRVLEDEVRLYGTEGHALTDLFYYKLGFQPDPRVTHASYKPDALLTLLELDPERIILFWSEKEHVERLWHNPLWRSLRAVREKQVYYPETRDWDPWGPLGREYMIHNCMSYFLKAIPSI